MFVVRDRIKLGLWRESFMKLVFLDHPNKHMQNVMAGKRTTVAAKELKLHPKHYYNSPAGSFPWQQNMT